METTTTTTSHMWVLLLVGLVGYLIAMLPVMGIFAKAGESRVAAYVPIWNTLTILKIVGRPWWWLLLLLIPFVDIVVAIIIAHDLSKAFGHGVGFTLGLIFLSWIFALILWLGGSRYVGPAGGPRPMFT